MIIYEIWLNEYGSISNHVSHICSSILVGGYEKYRLAGGSLPLGQDLRAITLPYFQFTLSASACERRHDFSTFCPVPMLVIFVWLPHLYDLFL